MRILWLLTAIVSSFGAGILVAFPVWPAWKVQLPNSQIVSISPDGRRLLVSQLSPPSTWHCTVAHTETGDITEKWVQQSAPYSVRYSETSGFTSFVAELVPLTESELSQAYQLRVSDTKGQNKPYVARVTLETLKPRIVSVSTYGNYVAINLDVSSSNPRGPAPGESFTRNYVGVLVDLRSQRHRVIEHAYLSGASDDQRYLLVYDQKGLRVVADPKDGQPVMRIPGESLLTVERHGESYRVFTAKAVPGRDPAIRYARYVWTPGQEPRLLEESAPYSVHQDWPGRTPFVDGRSETVYLREPMKYDCPEMVRKVMQWFQMDDYFERWQQCDFATGKVLRTWKVTSISQNTLVLFHLPTQRAYYCGTDGNLTAWDLPPRSLAPWGYGCFGLSLGMFVMYLAHRRIFRANLDQRPLRGSSPTIWGSEPVTRSETPS